MTRYQKGMETSEWKLFSMAHWKRFTGGIALPWWLNWRQLTHGEEPGVVDFAPEGLLTDKRESPARHQ